MASGPEAKVVKWLCSNRTRQIGAIFDTFPGCYLYNTPGGQFGQAGAPDMFICWRGKFIGLEVKSDKGKPTKLQLMRIDEIRKAGGIAEVIYGKDQGMLDDIKSVILGDLCQN